MNKLKKNVLKLEDGIEEMISDLNGASRTILIDEKTVGAEDITFGHSKFEPHTSVHKKHIHKEAEEIMYMLKGRGISGVNENETEIGAGDTVWVPRAAVHWFYNPFDEPCEFILLILNLSPINIPNRKNEPMSSENLMSWYGRFGLKDILLFKRELCNNVSEFLQIVGNMAFFMAIQVGKPHGMME